MKHIRHKWALHLFLLMMVLFAACKPVQNRIIIKGKWLVHRVHTDFVQMDNAMEFFLPGYQSNHSCCTYMVDFKDDETVTGTYTKDNMVVQIDSGVWHLDKFNVLYVKLGKYIDGTYDIERHKNRRYTLYTEKNNLVILPTQPAEITKVTIDIERLKK
jgi:hypothetical protein